MNSLLAPAFAILGRFKYSGKFAIVGLLFAGLIAGLLAVVVTQQTRAVSTTRQELRGGEVLPRLLNLMAAVQQHRGMSTVAAAERQAAVPALQSKRAEVDRLFAELEAQAAGSGDVLRISDRLARLSAQWTTAAVSDGTPLEVFERHSAVIDQIRGLLEWVGDTSLLVLEPDVVPYRLSDLAINGAPALAEMYARVQGIGAIGLADGAFTAEDGEALSAPLYAIREQRGRLVRSAELIRAVDATIAARVVAPLKDLARAEEDTGRAIQELRRGRGMTAAEWFKASGAPVESSFALVGTATPALTEVLTARLAVERRSLAVNLGIVAIYVLVILYLATAFFVSTSRAVSALVEAAKACSTGDFSGRVHIESRDEMAVIADSFNHMAGSVGRLIHEIQDGVATLGEACVRLSHASHQVAAESQQQSDAARGMASSVEQLSTSIVSVSESVQDTVSASEQARQLSLSGEALARDTAGEIGRMADAVRASTATIGRLSEQSSRVNGIVRVIRDVADQTNLLALNAAIEAARAGELGRGFAVVADEVRKLAERTATATTEISQVIESIEQSTRDSVAGIQSVGACVDSGVSHAQRAAEALQEIQAGATTTLERISTIAGVTREQRSSSQDIANSVEAIARMVDRNDAAVRDINAVVEDVERQVNQVAALTARFTVA